MHIKLNKWKRLFTIHTYLLTRNTWNDSVKLSRIMVVYLDTIACITKIDIRNISATSLTAKRGNLKNINSMPKRKKIEVEEEEERYVVESFVS